MGVGENTDEDEINEINEKQRQAGGKNASTFWHSSSFKKQ